MSCELVVAVLAIRVHATTHLISLGADPLVERKRGGGTACCCLPQNDRGPCDESSEDMSLADSATTHASSDLTSDQVLVAA